jgi:hypothetical protein
MATIARLGGGAGLIAVTLMWLLRRGDALQQENIAELRRQRDDYRTRYEQERARADRLEAELLRRLDTGELPIMRRPDP